MTQCSEIQSRLPDRRGDHWNPRDEKAFEEHLATCSECSDVWDTVQRVRSVRPEPPGELEGAIRASLRAELARHGRFGEGAGGRKEFRGWAPRWFAPAAAVLVLALGTGLVWDRLGGEGASLPVLLDGDSLAAEAAAADLDVTAATPWDEGDHSVAGAPILSELTDAQLERLLEEMEG